jgi:hypothetical protein
MLVGIEGFTELERGINPYTKNGLMCLFRGSALGRKPLRKM